MLAAGSRYEEQSNRHRPLRRAHVLQGHGAPPELARPDTLVDGIGGEFNAFTSKEYTGYYVRCAGADRDIALDVLIDMIRNSKFDPEEIEREKGVILEEMNMYFDTPRDYIGSVYEALMFGDNPLGWETLGTKDTIKGATRDTFTRLRQPLVHARPDGDRRQRPWSATTCPTLERCSARCPRTARPSSSRSGCRRRRARACHKKDSDQAQICIGVPTPARIPTATRSAARDRARHGHVVAPLPRGARAPRARLLRLRLEPLLHRRRLALRAGGRRPRADRRRDHRIVELSSAWPTSRCRPRSSRRPARSRRAASSSTPSPQGLIMFGLRREVLEEAHPSRARSSPSSTRSPRRTSSASRRT